MDLEQHRRLILLIYAGYRGRWWPSPVGARIVPVAEFLMHISDAGPLVDALRSSGQLQHISDLTVGFLARMIERHITALAGTTPAVPAPLVSRMLAGALMEMVEWWGDHQSTMTQTQMDATFHALARTLLRRASYEVANQADG